ncbi:head maturation protease, ClpP-related [Fodinicurvata sp. EGI_FJ10296]|uniref:head maturation protease, ClpP-related n=1 Tax=Fodinicurvata sp. EGI_FJ10296 TaxID=3231908 RepID=UPI0034552C06
MTARSWFTMTATAAGAAEIWILDEIGAFGVSAAGFARDLAALGEVDAITLRVTSPGGAVFDAIAIHNILRRHPATVTARIEGVAASAASLIVMAADRIEMPGNALMMIHDPAGSVAGGPEQMRQMAEGLSRIRDGVVAVYAERSGQTPESVRSLMAAETWMTAEEAVAAGFADAVLDPVTVTARFEAGRYFADPPRDLALCLSPSHQPERIPMPDPSPQPNADPAMTADPAASPAPVPAAPAEAPAVPPGIVGARAAATTQPSAPAGDTAAIRRQAAAVMRVAEQARMLNVTVDAMAAIEQGVDPGALRQAVLDAAANAAAAAPAIVTARPVDAPNQPAPGQGWDAAMSGVAGKSEAG